MSAVYFPRIRKKHSWLITTYILFFIFLLEFYILNEYVGIVTWMAFRHYLGFIPVLFVAATGVLNLFFKRLDNTKDK